MDKPTPKYKIGETFIREGRSFTLTEVNENFNGKFYYISYVAQAILKNGTPWEINCVEENLDEWFQNSLRFIFD